MTCIVGLLAGPGLVAGKGVVIGGDSAGVAGYLTVVRADPKVFRTGPFLIGYTSSFRMGQLLRFRLSVPARHPDVDVFQFMVTTFVDAVRDCLKAGGCAEVNNAVESGGTFLVGYAGRLFEIDGDYQVGEPADGYAAVGGGAELALGALHATADRPADERVQAALAAAAYFSTGVRPPFVIERLE